MPVTIVVKNLAWLNFSFMLHSFKTTLEQIVPLLEYIPFIFLSISLLTLCFRPVPPFSWHNAWFISFILTCIAAYFLQQMEWNALLITALIFTLAWSIREEKLPLIWRRQAIILFILAALALGLHILPGFNSLLVIENTQFTADAKPYSLYLNIDKTLIAVFILGFIYQRPRHLLSWSVTARYLSWLLPVLIFIILFAAFTLGYIRYEPKLINELGLWMWANLLFTCTAEEAFFRALIQQQLMNRLKLIKAGKWLALLLASMLFGVAHIAGGWEYVVLSTIAGLGYGYVYQLSGRIEASIITHFIVNLVHITLFTYPALIAS